jgi:hypothetical protein
MPAVTLRRSDRMRSSELLPGHSKAIALAASMLLTVMASVSLAAHRPSKALVIGISGPCEALPSQTPLGIGSELALGQKVFFPYPRKSTYYVDILMPNGQVDTFECSGWLTCLVSHQVPHWTGDDKLLPGRLDALKDVVLPSNEQDYVNADVRGDSATDEMVLKSIDNRLDVSPVILDAPEGTYTLTFAPRPEGTVVAPPHTFTLKVPMMDPGEARVGPIDPGVYVVTVTGPTRKLDWILVTDAAGYAAAEESLRRAKELTDSWGSQVRDQSVHNFLRAYLVSLAHTGDAP